MTVPEVGRPCPRTGQMEGFLTKPYSKLLYMYFKTLAWLLPPQNHDFGEWLVQDEQIWMHALFSISLKCIKLTDWVALLEFPLISRGHTSLEKWLGKYPNLWVQNRSVINFLYWGYFRKNLRIDKSVTCNFSHLFTDPLMLTQCVTPSKDRL